MVNHFNVSKCKCSFSFLDSYDYELLKGMYSDWSKNFSVPELYLDCISFVSFIYFTIFQSNSQINIKLRDQFYPFQELVN